MKNWNKKPIVWFIVILIISYAIAGDVSEFEGVIIFILAIMVSKQIEIVNSIDRLRDEK